MAATNRAAKITKLVSALKKHYKPVPKTRDLPLLETILFASLLENAPHDAAEQAFTALEDGYFGWNEVRVTTKQELSEALKGLPDPADAASRLKTTLNSLFEEFYSFDLEAMKKQNLGQSVKQLEKLAGTTRFIVSYAVQNALGGHAIAVNDGLLIALETLDVISPAEAKAGSVPGLERAVPKSKGAEVGSVLHQLGVEIGKNPYGTNARKRLLAIDPKCKDRLPKRPAPPKPAPKAEPTPPPKKAPAKPEAKPAKKEPASKPAAPKAAAAKPAPAKRTPAGKATGKPAARKKVVKKVVKKKAKKKIVKAAPGKKAAPKKPAAKKPAAKKKVAKGRVVKKKVVKKAVKKKASAKRKPR